MFDNQPDVPETQHRKIFTCNSEEAVASYPNSKDSAGTDDNDHRNEIVSYVGSHSGHAVASGSSSSSSHFGGRAHATCIHLDEPSISSSNRMSGNNEMEEDPDVRVFTVVDDHELFQVPSAPTLREVDCAYQRLFRSLDPEQFIGGTEFEWISRAFKQLQERYQRLRTKVASQLNAQEAAGVEETPPPQASSASYAEPDPADHISLVAGADVFFVEDDFVFFNVSPAPSVKELDKSFRQLAVKMHPDKNGGSVQAKEAFQYLQLRYERFRATIK